MSGPVSRHQQDSALTEHRVRPRLGFDCLVRWNNGGVDRFGWARDISEVGAGFTVRPMSAPTVGEEIRLVFELDSERQWIVDEHALVERCDKRSDHLYDVGVRLNLVDMD